MLSLVETEFLKIYFSELELINQTLNLMHNTQCAWKSVKNILPKCKQETTEQDLSPWPNISINIEHRKNIKIHSVQEFGHNFVFTISVGCL